MSHATRSRSIGVRVEVLLEERSEGRGAYEGVVSPDMIERLQVLDPAAAHGLGSGGSRTTSTCRSACGASCAIFSNALRPRRTAKLIDARSRRSGTCCGRLRLLGFRAYDFGSGCRERARSASSGRSTHDRPFASGAKGAPEYRFVLACGSAPEVRRHPGRWRRGEVSNGDAEAGTERDRPRHDLCHTPKAPCVRHPAPLAHGNRSLPIH